MKRNTGQPQFFATELSVGSEIVGGNRDCSSTGAPSRMLQGGLALGFLLVFLSLSACTSTMMTSQPLDWEKVEDLEVGSTEVIYGEDLTNDLTLLAHEHRVAHEVARFAEEWPTETGRWGGKDSVRIELNRFHLPSAGSHGAVPESGPDDFLGTTASILRGGAALSTLQVDYTLSTTDRSITESWSANLVLDNLIKSVAWSIAHQLTPFEYRREIFEVGKREIIQPAIEMLELCGELTYGEAFSFSAAKKISFKVASGVEARRIKWLFGGERAQCY